MRNPRGAALLPRRRARRRDRQQRQRAGLAAQQHSQSHYAAAKAGVMALTRCSAIEAVEYGVRINAVSRASPGTSSWRRPARIDLLDRLSEGEAFGRAAEPWEVAATIAFLASDYSSYLTGEVISVSSQHP